MVDSPDEVLHKACKLDQANFDKRCFKSVLVIPCVLITCSRCLSAFFSPIDKI